MYLNGLAYPNEGNFFIGLSDVVDILDCFVFTEDETK